MILVFFALQALLYLFLAAAVFSWIPPTSSALVEEVRRAILRITEPVVRPVRRILPPIRVGTAGVDLSYTVTGLILIALVNFLGRHF